LKAYIVPVALILFVGIMSLLAVWSSIRRPLPKPVTRQDLQKFEQRIYDHMDKKFKEQKETTESPGWLKDPLAQRHLRLSLAVNRGGNWESRIDNYLADTPLAGQGRTFYLAAIDAGIDPKLMPAIAMIESGAGRQNANVNNFFGRKAPGGGWQHWPTKTAAIKDQAFYIARMWGTGATPYNMRSYCVPQFPWANKVAVQMARV